jgi:hypothetical protein
MTDSTEQVYTITDYYDGPRCGMAGYLGRRHLYRSLWADIDHERDDVFELFPVDEETFTLAVEDWRIWQRWRAAFDRGEVSIDSHPALPADRQRHNEIELILKPRLAVFAESDTTVIGEFEWPQLDYRLQGAPARVRWIPTERPANLPDIEMQPSDQT